MHCQAKALERRFRRTDLVQRKRSHLLHRYWEDMYAKELDADSWKQVNELRKTRPEGSR
jgi:hypothetical protein